MMNEDLFHLGIKGLVTNSDGNILLLKVNPAELHGSNNNNDYWDLPGGRVQRGGSIEDTLIREVEEELGVKEITIGKSIGMVLSNIRIPLEDGSSIGLILGVYECTLPANTKIKLSFEHIAYQWFSPAEAATLLHVKYPKDFCELVAEL